MKAEIDLPPLPDGWATGPVEIGYGEPPRNSMVLTHIGWQRNGGSNIPFVYAIRKWQPAIVTAGVLAPGWVVIDFDGTYYFSIEKPRWCELDCEWISDSIYCLCALEKPQATGRNAIWEIK